MVASSKGTSVGESLLDAARNYLRRGYAPVPIPRGEKGPRISDWPSFKPNEEEVPAYFRQGENIGLILGTPSGGLVDVDLDSPESIIAADFLLPPTSLIHGRPSRPRSHWWYHCDVTPISQRFLAVDKKSLIELRSDGSQTMVPPSVHPRGEPLAWVNNGEPARVNARSLLDAVARVAAAALLARHWPSQGARNDCANAVAGMLLRAGWGEEEATRFVRAVATAAADDEVSKRARDVVSTANRLRMGRTATGIPTLERIVGDEVVRLIRPWLGASSQETEDAVNWPDPIPLRDELLSVPPFDLELLPESFRPLVADISERMQAPADYSAAALVVALAGCVNRRATIIPKKQDQSWRVVPNLWGAIVAPPGMMKSPILRTATSPLEQIEEKWRADFESSLSALQVEKEQAEIRHQAWRERSKIAAKKGVAFPSPPESPLVEPKLRRLTLTDATFEKLHAILAENPAGLFVIRDELTGWLAELDRSGREGERAFFLQAWNGDASFSVDRIGRGSIYVSAVCVSLLGNIQPARLRSYLADVIQGGAKDDGLFQRFQILVWPDLHRVWKLVDRPANDTALQIVTHIFSLLSELSGDTPVVLRFAPDAQILFFEWWSVLETRIRGDSGLTHTFVAHLAKYRSLMPSLAGLFELADRAAADEALTGEICISLSHTKQAAAFCEYLEAHAQRVYSCAITPETQSGRELLRHVKSGDLGAQFKTREIYRHAWSGLDTPERVRAALGLLEQLGWIRRQEVATSPFGGRPTEIWVANPKAVRGA